ncbi:hypothetical protein [Schleiferilactobacillus perolens]|jgi:hypothetical protein|uniref:hypothetical protein n=1 Tax=Schleiferilactobacillus perolens TaxID=100468 RepID=UPI002353F937|nr:hypothetical protein [Schleiferilactobacillus perolens]MCI2170987.1 hypothetical protein [Schleiferilactobacillus perolens]
MAFPEERANALLKEAENTRTGLLDLAWYAASLEASLLIFTKEKVALMPVKPEAIALMKKVQEKSSKHGNA